VDIRGSVDQRLALLDRGEIEGVIMAEAALIRLKLTQRLRHFLTGDTPPLQGKLAVVARKEDLEMRELFAPLNRKAACL
jgi:porphobilinogen deaminase